MKNLFLIRHAKSSWDNPSIPDCERQLSKKGLKDAPFMGELLKKKSVMPDLILSSTANRAVATAKIFAEELKYLKDIQVEKDLYQAGTEELLSVIKEVNDSNKNIFVVGHNPGLSHFLNYLADTDIDDIPTCGVVSLKLKVDSWKKLGEKTCKVEFFEYPKKYLK
jgi:phosphohistidine phosphatase